MKAENSEFSSLKIPLQSTFRFRAKNYNTLSLYLHELCFFLCSVKFHLLNLINYSILQDTKTGLDL